jgi:hypothetical protein
MKVMMNRRKFLFTVAAAAVAAPVAVEAIKHSEPDVWAGPSRTMKPSEIARETAASDGVSLMSMSHDDLPGWKASGMTMSKVDAEYDRRLQRSAALEHIKLTIEPGLNKAWAEHYGKYLTDPNPWYIQQ